jgi:hypothetical protein
MRHLIGLGVLFLVGVAHAATVPNSAITAQGVDIQATQFVAASTPGTYVTVFTGDADGSKVTGIIVTSSDNAANVVTCQINKTGTRVGGATVSVPLNSGFANAAPAIDFLAPTLWPGLPRDGDGNPVIPLTDASDKIDCTYATALTGIEVINVVVTGSDF